MEDVQYLLRQGTAVEQSFLFVIDSAMRERASYPTPSEYYIPFPMPFRNVFAVDLIEATVPRTEYSIEAGSNTLCYAPGSWARYEDARMAGTLVSVTIQPGDYNTPQLISALNDTLNARALLASHVPLVIEAVGDPVDITNTIKFVRPEPFVLFMNESTIRNWIGFGNPATTPGATVAWNGSARFSTDAAVANDTFVAVPSPLVAPNLAFAGPVPIELAEYTLTLDATTTKVRQTFTASSSGLLSSFAIKGVSSGPLRCEIRDTSFAPPALVADINAAATPDGWTFTTTTNQSPTLHMVSAVLAGQTTSSGQVGIAATFTVTVVYESAYSYSGNVYVIDGANKPILALQRGGVYTFLQSNATNSNHPIAFKDASGAAYTTGVVSSGTPGSAGAQTVITVAANAPSGLRYYCTVHGNGMGSTIGVSSALSGTTLSEITVTLTGLHGFAVGNIFEIKDATTLALNGRWTVSAITNTNTFRFVCATTLANIVLGKAVIYAPRQLLAGTVYSIQLESTSLGTSQKVYRAETFASDESNAVESYSGEWTTTSEYDAISMDIQVSNVGFVVTAPGQCNLTGERYVLIRSPDIEQHLNRDLAAAYDRMAPGMGMVRFGGLGVHEERFFGYETRKFHPIGKLKGIRIRLETRAGRLYDTHGIDHTLLCRVKMYAPGPSQAIPRDLFPGYNPNAHAALATKLERERDM